MTIRRAAVALLAIALTALGWLVASPARADEAYPIRVDITSVSTDTIPLTTPDVVRISGTITNTSDRPVSWVTVEFWRTQSAITTPDQLDEAVEASPEAPPGARLRNADSGNMVTITQADEFAPGASASFSVKATVTQLGFATEGAYRIGIHVRALAADGLVRTVGINRWLVPVTSSGHPHAAVSVLTSAPSMTAPATFIDDHLAAELTGRLADLLTLAERPGATFVLDPALYDEVRALTDQHLVAGVTQGAVPAAAPTLARLDALIAAGTGYRLPYGNPDLAAAADADNLAGTLDRAAFALASAHPVAKLPPAVVGGSAQVAAALDPKAVVFTPDARGSSATLVATTPFPTRGLSPATPTAMQLRSHQLAEELVGSLAGRPVVRLLSTTDDIAAERTTAWRTLGAPATTGTATWVERPRPGVDERYAEVATWAERVELYRSISNPTSAITTATQVSLKAQSAAFDAPAASAYLRAAAPAQLAKSPAQLRAQPNVVLSGRENQFPISITNTSNTPITVRVRFDSSSPQRIDVADSDPVTIGAGETVGLTATATASTNGIVTVNAHLSSASGKQIGPDQVIEITSTEAGRVGWVIIVASAMLFVGGTVWRVRAVQRERAKTATGEAE